MSDAGTSFQIVAALAQIDPYVPYTDRYGEWAGNECHFCRNDKDTGEHEKDCLWLRAKNCIKNYFDAEDMGG